MALLNINKMARRCSLPACSPPRRSWKPWIEPARGFSLEGRWYCSPECFQQTLTSTIGQLLSAKPRSPATTHRAPLGLLMLSRGLVDQDQLREALNAQKESGTGRVGEWLRHLGAVTEEEVTQALGFQWSIPVFPLDQSRKFLDCANLVPFPLLKVAEMLPVHHLPDSQHLYVAFVDRVNHSALYALEKILDCHTEPCLAVQSRMLTAWDELCERNQLVEILVDAISDPEEIAGAILAQFTRLSATDVRVSGFDGHIWARLNSPAGFTDLIFQAGPRPCELFAADKAP